MHPFFDTPQDIFWIALAVVTLWCGVMLGLILYYVAMSMRDVRAITANIKSKLQRLDDLITSIQRKVETTAAIIPPLIKNAEKLNTWWKGSTTTSRSRKKK